MMQFEIYYIDGDAIAQFATYEDASHYYMKYCSIVACRIRTVNDAEFPDDAEEIAAKQDNSA